MTKSISLLQNPKRVKTDNGWYRDDIVQCDGREIGFVRFEQTDTDFEVTTHHKGTDESVSGMNLSWLVQQEDE